MTAKRWLQILAGLGVVIAIAGISAGSVVGPIVGLLGGGYAYYRSRKADDTHDFMI